MSFDAQSIAGRRVVTLAVIHAAIIAVFLLAGFVHPRRRGPLVSRDTLLNLTNGALLAGLKMLLVVAFAANVSVQRCDLSGVKHPALQMLVVFLLSDFTRYWVHYLHHRVDFLWQFHRVHHSSARLDASSGLRMHVVDFIQLSLIPVVLFGLLFDCSTFAWWVWPALVIVTDVFDSLQHANLRMSLTSSPAAAWDLVFNNPVFHSWYHSADPGEYNGNFGQALTVWDRLFNTHIPHREAADELGLPLEEQLETSLIGLQSLRLQGMKQRPRN